VHGIFPSREQEHRQQLSVEAKATLVRAEDENSDGDEEGAGGTATVERVARYTV